MVAWLVGNGHQEICGVAWVQLVRIRKFRLVGNSG